MYKWYSCIKWSYTHGTVSYTRAGKIRASAGVNEMVQNAKQIFVAVDADGKRIRGKYDGPKISDYDKFRKYNAVCSHKKML